VGFFVEKINRRGGRVDFASTFTEKIRPPGAAIGLSKGKNIALRRHGTGKASIFLFVLVVNDARE
jgi:hypothetical protein